MGQYRALYASVDALQYDGTPESALAIAKAYPGKIARDLERDGVILALSCEIFDREELREVPAGSWLVRRTFLSSRLHLETDASFRPYHKRIDA